MEIFIEVVSITFSCLSIVGIFAIVAQSVKDPLIIFVDTITRPSNFRSSSVNVMTSNLLFEPQTCNSPTF
jgi:hypothetical protein